MHHNYKKLKFNTFGKRLYSFCDVINNHPLSYPLAVAILLYVAIVSWSDSLPVPAITQQQDAMQTAQIIALYEREKIEMRQCYIDVMPTLEPHNMLAVDLRDVLEVICGKFPTKPTIKDL